ncbi:MAG: DUF2268 domain-containing putative Zn-dependent protease [Spirochaetota bacterium]
MEKNKFTCFKTYYFEKHKDFLSEVFFKFQGFTLRNIIERVNMIRKQDYAELENALKIYDIEEHTTEIILLCKNLLGSHDICHVFLYIGFFSPDAFVIRYSNDYVICVGLERFRNFINYDVLLSHEFGHYIQNKRKGPGNEGLICKLVREGISVYFSRLAFPGKKENEYLFLKRQNYNFLNLNYQHFLDRLKNHHTRIEDLFRTESKVFPPRAGYFLGYRIVQEYVKKIGPEDINQLIEVDERSILSEVVGTLEWS